MLLFNKTIIKKIYISQKTISKVITLEIYIFHKTITIKMYQI